jgi:hypothetical protein
MEVVVSEVFLLVFGVRVRKGGILRLAMMAEQFWIARERGEYLYSRVWELRGKHEAGHEVWETRRYIDQRSCEESHWIPGDLNTGRARQVNETSLVTS